MAQGQLNRWRNRSNKQFSNPWLYVGQIIRTNNRSFRCTSILSSESG